MFHSSPKNTALCLFKGHKDLENCQYLKLPSLIGNLHKAHHILPFLPASVQWIKSCSSSKTGLEYKENQQQIHYRMLKVLIK